MHVWFQSNTVLFDVSGHVFRCKNVNVLHMWSDSRCQCGYYIRYTEHVTSFLYVCVQAHVCASNHTHVSVHVGTNGQSQVSFHRCHTPGLIFIVGSVIGNESRLPWLASNSQISPASAFLVQEFQMGRCTCLCHVASEDWTQVFLPAGTCLLTEPCVSPHNCELFWISKWFWPKTFQGTILDQCWLSECSVDLLFTMTMSSCYASSCFEHGHFTRR